MIRPLIIKFNLLHTILKILKSPWLPYNLFSIKWYIIACVPETVIWWMWLRFCDYCFVCIWRIQLIRFVSISTERLQWSDFHAVFQNICNKAFPTLNIRFILCTGPCLGGAMSKIKLSLWFLKKNNYMFFCQGISFWKLETSSFHQSSSLCYINSQLSLEDI